MCLNATPVTCASIFLHMYPQSCHVTTLHFTRVNSAIKRAYLQLYIYKLHVAYSFIESEQKGNYFHYAERMINEEREKREKKRKGREKDKNNQTSETFKLKFKSNEDKNSTEN